MNSIFARQPLAFGPRTCVYCLGDIPSKKNEVWIPVKKPLVEQGEVLVPRGTQVFHRACLEEYKRSVK